MSGLVNILAILAALVLVVRRQFQTRRFDTERRFWLLPLILAVLALREPHLIDSGHQVAAIALLVASVLVELAMGSVWGWTVRIWREGDGTVWIKGTAATAVAWGGMLVLRVGLYGLGAALHVRQGTNVLLLSIGVLLLVRGLVVNWRARGVEAPHGLHPVG